MEFGTITRWVEDHGFGLITPDRGGDDVIVDASEFDNAGFIAEVGDRIRYEIETDQSSGKPRAIKVQAG